MNNLNNDQFVDEELDINFDLLGIFKRRYLHLLFGVSVGLVLAFFYFSRQVPIYESELAILVGQRSGDLASTGFQDGAESSTVQQEVLSTHMELFGSRKIISEAIDKQNVPLTVQQVQGNLTVSVGGSGSAKNASLLHASYRDDDPERAAKVLHWIFDSYHEYIDEKSRNVGTEAAQLIANSLVECERNLKLADQEYRDHVKSIPALVTSDLEGNDRIEDVHRIRLAHIESQLSHIREELAQTRSRRAVIREFALGKKPSDVSDMEVMSLLTEAELGRLQSFIEMAYMRSRETPDELVSREVNRNTANIETQKLLEIDEPQG